MGWLLEGNVGYLWTNIKLAIIQCNCGELSSKAVVLSTTLVQSKRTDSLKGAWYRCWLVDRVVPGYLDACPVKETRLDPYLYETIVKARWYKLV